MRDATDQFGKLIEESVKGNFEDREYQGSMKGVMRS